MPWLVQQRLGRALLHDLPEVHHRDAPGDLAHHREVVSDEEVGEAPLPLEVGEQVQHLRLHRDVERGDRLVADDERRLHRERPGDADPLALASGELVGIPARMARIEAHLLQQPGHLPRHVLAAGEPVDPDAFGDRGAHRHPRVERAVRVLKDDLHPAAHLPERDPIQREEIAPLEHGGSRGRLLQPENGAAYGRFPASRFAHQPQRFPVLHVERHAVHRPDRVRPRAEQAAGVVVLHQIAHLQHAHGTSPCSASQHRM
jgi:hypothetical protein